MRHNNGTLEATQQLVFKIWNPKGPINIPETKLKSTSKSILIPKKTISLKRRPFYKPFFKQETQSASLNFFIQRSDSETSDYTSEIKHVYYYFLRRSLKWKQFIFPLQRPFSLDNLHYCYDTSIINKANLRFYKSSFLCGQTKAIPDQEPPHFQAYLEQSTTTVHHHNFSPPYSETIALEQNKSSTFSYLFAPLKLELRLNKEPKIVNKPFIIAIHASSLAPLKNLSTLSLSPVENLSMYHYKTEDLSYSQKTFFYIAKAKQEGPLNLPVFSAQLFNKDSQEFETVSTKEQPLSILKNKLPLKKATKIASLNTFNVRVPDPSLALIIISIMLILANLYSIKKKPPTKQKRKP